MTSLRLFAYVMLISFAASDTQEFRVRRLKTEVKCDSNGLCSLPAITDVKDMLKNNAKVFTDYAKNQVLKMKKEGDLGDKESTTTPPKVSCAPEELPYANRCYFIEMLSTGGNYAQLESLCISKGAKPADIVDETPFKEVLDYFSSINKSTANFRRIMLGTTKTSHTKPPLPYIKWRVSGVEFTDAKPHLVVRIYKNDDTLSGMDPVSNSIYVEGVLCVKT